MEPIFAQLSLEYLLAGRTLPWNKERNLIPGGSLVMIKADLSKAKSQYFNL